MKINLSKWKSKNWRVTIHIHNDSLLMRTPDRVFIYSCFSLQNLKNLENSFNLCVCIMYHCICMQYHTACMIRTQRLKEFSFFTSVSLALGLDYFSAYMNDHYNFTCIAISILTEYACNDHVISCMLKNNWAICQPKSRVSQSSIQWIILLYEARSFKNLKMHLIRDIESRVFHYFVKSDLIHVVIYCLVYIQLWFWK